MMIMHCFTQGTSVGREGADGERGDWTKHGCTRCGHGAPQRKYWCSSETGRPSGDERYKRGSAKFCSPSDLRVAAGRGTRWDASGPSGPAAEER